MARPSELAPAPDLERASSISARIRRALRSTNPDPVSEVDLRGFAGIAIFNLLGHSDCARCNRNKRICLQTRMGLIFGIVAPYPNTIRFY